jgi:hypothetical protein
MPKEIHDLDDYIKKSGITLIILGFLHFIASEYLLFGAGIVLIFLGIISLIFRKKWMLAVFGTLLILIGLWNILPGEEYFGLWTILGIFQIYWGIKEIKFFLSLDKRKKRNVKYYNKVGGWLLFFTITLFLAPLAVLSELINSKEWYMYGGTYDIGSLLTLVAFAVWAIFIGYSILKKKTRAIVWAKEYLIAGLIINLFGLIISYSSFSFEEQSVLFGEMIMTVITFSIWYSYLQVSKRVKATFNETETSVKRVLSIAGIGIVLLFILMSIGLFLQPIVETETETFSPSTDEIIRAPLIEILEPGNAVYYELNNQEEVSDIFIEFDAGKDPVDVYVVKSKEDFNKYIKDLDFEIYSGCHILSKTSGNMNCVVSSGGVIVSNNNFEKEIQYSLGIY